MTSTGPLVLAVAVATAALFGWTGAANTGPLVLAVAVATAVLLGWTGAAKLRGRASTDGLTALLGTARRARVAARAAGVAELTVAVALLAVPRVGGVAAAALGVVFLGYLVAAGRVAPGASCGCAGSSRPVTWRTYARASAVTVAGAVTGWLGEPLLPVATAAPAASVGQLVLALLGYLTLSAELDRLWLRPLRRLRLQALGHPLSLPGAPVPVAASVELLEASRAWQAAAHLVRSSLLEHWTADGWRVLRYAGRHDTGDGARPVTVLFAVDVHATVSAPRGTAVRVTVVDDDTGQVLDDPPLRPPRTRPLPVA